MKQKAYFLSAFACLLLSLSACAHRKPVVLPDEPTVFSWIQSTNPESPMTGKISLWSAPEGVKIRVVVTGATPGLHGIHIHENGDCSDAGNAAGGHFNPDKVQHGDILKDGLKSSPRRSWKYLGGFNRTGFA